jgi:hypothetical protein
MMSSRAIKLRPIFLTENDVSVTFVVLVSRATVNEVVP